MTEASDSTKKSNSILTLNDFNSRLNLTEKDQLGDEYDTSANRDQEQGTSSSGALAHLLKSSLGSGILAMPMAFNNAGLVFGMVGTLVIGFLCTHCVHILVKTSQSLCKDLRVPALTYAETAEKAFQYGPKRLRSWSKFAREFVDWGLMGTYYATVSVYTVLIATSFHDVINYNYNLDWDIRVYIAITILPCLLIGQVRSLKWLVPFSVLANIFIVATFGITLYYMFNVPLVFSDKPLIAKATQIPVFFTTVVFALEGIGTVMPIENSMKKPQHFLGCPSVLNIAMIVVVGLYAIIGFFGYVRYGSDIRGSITLNLEPGTPAADAAKILMALAILFTYGLQFYVVCDILWRKISYKFEKKNHNCAQIGLRTGIILLAGAIAEAIPELEPFISLVGAIFLSLLGILMPSFIESVYLWPNFLGWCKWKLIKNIFLGVLSILALVAGVTASVNKIIEMYKK